MRRWPAAVLAGAFLATGAALAVVAARGPAPPVSMDDRVRQVASTLACPDCVDLSVADSPSPTARHMRATIARQLQAGRSLSEIRDYFVAHFGSSILLTPEGHGIDLAAWIAPGVLLAVGLALLAATLRRWRRAGRHAPLEPEELTEGDRALLDRELAAAEADPE